MDRDLEELSKTFRQAEEAYRSVEDSIRQSFAQLPRALEAVANTDMEALRLGSDAAELLGSTALAQMPSFALAADQLAAQFAAAQSLVSESLRSEMLATASAQMSSLDWNTLAEIDSVASQIASSSRFAGSIMDVAERVSSQFDFLTRSTLLDDWVKQVQELGPYLEQYQRALELDDDALQAGLTARAAVRAVFEGITGLETRPDSPEKLLKLRVKTIWILLVLLWKLYQANATAQDRALELAAHRAIERQQAERKLCPSGTQPLMSVFAASSFASPSAAGAFAGAPAACRARHQVTSAVRVSPRTLDSRSKIRPHAYQGRTASAGHIKSRTGQRAHLGPQWTGQNLP